MAPLLLGGTVIREVILPTKGFRKAYCRKKIWRSLQQMGVRRAAMAEKLEQEAKRWGVDSVPIAPLRRALLPQLYEKCEVMTSDAVALRAEEALPEVYRAAEFLCRCRRYLVLDIQFRGDALAEWLRQQYGISAGSLHRRVCGGITFSGEPRCAELHLGDDCRKYQEVQYEAAGQKVPEELLAALWQAGGIKAGEIRVVSLRSRLDTAT